VNECAQRCSNYTDDACSGFGYYNSNVNSSFSTCVLAGDGCTTREKGNENWLVNPEKEGVWKGYRLISDIPKYELFEEIGSGTC
jgi:hypothetical protein